MPCLSFAFIILLLLCSIVGSIFILTSSPLQHFATEQQIKIVVEQEAILSNNIETNPGPFFEECFFVVRDFCSDENSDNAFYLRSCVKRILSNQTQDHPIPFPEDFLTDENVDIWRRCELKIKRNTAFDDEFRKALQNIWFFWSEAKFQKELKDARTAIQQTPNSQSESGENVTPISSKASIEHRSISLVDQNKKRCGVYKYGRSTDGKTFFCLDVQCKNTKLKGEGVTRQTLRCHARKTHLIDINFQTKKGEIIRKAWICQDCSKSFARKQTLVNHQRTYHPDLNSPSTNDAVLAKHKISNNSQGTSSPKAQLQTSGQHQITTSGNQRTYPTNNPSTSSTNDIDLINNRPSNYHQDCQDTRILLPIKNTTSFATAQQQTVAQHQLTITENQLSHVTYDICPSSADDVDQINNRNLQDSMLPSFNQVPKTNNTSNSATTHAETSGHPQMTISDNADNFLSSASYNFVSDIDFQDLLNRC
eukprot:GFUD01004235.1.p1 GENE.GFUD01004235.1~~GFUD01004235.1.p1  ORF type:complete len:479 (+),score=61.90 GFUD01004235.1:314-1750(+)